MNDTTTTDRRLAPPSGRFVLRIDPGLHAALRAQALQAGLSLNEYCARKLALPEGRSGGFFPEAVTRAASQMGGGLLGVVVFGSWARQELEPDSDVDLLMVVHDSVEIRRSLYRDWDAEPLTWDGRRVEPHFVHLPPPGERASSLWAEVATDGVVLFERGLLVSRRLMEIRQQIASGHLIRRTVQDQFYWVKET